MPTTAQQKNKQEPLDPIEVRVALARKGWTQGNLATALKTSITTINLTINHNTSDNFNKKIRQILAL